MHHLTAVMPARIAHGQKESITTANLAMFAHASSFCYATANIPSSAAIRVATLSFTARIETLDKSTT